MSGAAPGERRRAVVALLFLSLFWALDGLGPDLFPALRRSSLPLMEREAITYALPALVAAAYAFAQKRKWPATRMALAWAGVGLLIFAAPVLISLLAQSGVGELERVAIFSLTPVFAIVLEPYLGSAMPQGEGALAASLGAVAGALCIFPLNVPGTPGAALAVLAVIAAAACAAVGNCIAVRNASAHLEYSTATFLALACGAAGLAFAIAGMFMERSEWQLPHSLLQTVWIVAIDLPPLFLLFWLLRRMTAARMTVRFLLAPLLIILAGIVLEQPEITVRMVAGVVLMGGGAAWLLLAPDEDGHADRLGIG